MPVGMHDGMGSSGISSNNSPGNPGSSNSGNNNSNNNNNNNNQGSDSGHSRFDVGSGYYGEPTTNTSPSNDNNQVTDPGLVVALNNKQLQDYKISLGQMDDAMGRGTIVSTTLNKDGSYTYEQTPGIIETSKYQTANLKAFLDSDIPTNRQKEDTLNKLQALENTNLVGSKLSNSSASDFVLDNLNQAFANLKNDPNYSYYTDRINKVADTTFNSRLKEDPLGTFVKEGKLSFFGTAAKSLYDTYKSNKALEVLGYTGKVINERPDGSFDYSGGGILNNPDYLKGNIINPEINEVIPDLYTGLPDSMVNKYFDNITNGAFSQSYNDIKSRLETQISTSQNGKVHKDNIFYDYLSKEGLLNG